MQNLADSQVATFSGTSLPTRNTGDPSITFAGGGSLNSYLTAGTDLAFDQLPINQLTIVAKIYINTLAAAGIAEKNDGNNDSGFVFAWDSNGALRLTIVRSGLTCVSARSPAPSLSAKWVQVAFTWDGTVVTAAAAHLFVNGTEPAKAFANDGAGRLDGPTQRTTRSASATRALIPWLGPLRER
jgi:hypothetical protein